MLCVEQAKNFCWQSPSSGQATDPELAAAEAGTEVATQGAGEMEEETLFVDDMPTAADGGRGRRAEEHELDDRAC